MFSSEALHSSSFFLVKESDFLNVSLIFLPLYFSEKLDVAFIIFPQLIKYFTRYDSPLKIQ